MIVYRYEDRWLVVVNASNRQKVLDHFASRTDRFGQRYDQGPDRIDGDDRACRARGSSRLIGRFSREVPTLKRYRFL